MYREKIERQREREGSHENAPHTMEEQLVGLRVEVSLSGK
jgi:hypothetical protein